MSVVEENPKTDAAVDACQGKECLAFRLGSEIHTVDRSQVQEIRCPENVTRLPNQPEFVKGLLNLRGSLIPVIDSRQHLGLPLAEPAHGAAVIIFKVNSAVKEKMAGVVVDEIIDELAATDGHLVTALDLDLLLGPVLFQGRTM